MKQGKACDVKENFQAEGFGWWDEGFFHFLYSAGSSLSSFTPMIHYHLHLALRQLD
jgi:hypothetical protein